MSMNQKQAPLHFPCRGACFFLVIQPERGRQGTVLCLLFKGQMQETENRPLSPVSLSLLQFQTQRSEILNDLVELAPGESQWVEVHIAGNNTCDTVFTATSEGDTSVSDSLTPTC